MKGRILAALVLVLLASCEKGVTDEDTILKYFSEAYEDSGFGIAAAEDGYYLCGQLTDSIDGRNPLKKAGIIRTGNDGNLVGQMMTFGTTEGSAAKIKVLNDGSVISTGYVIGANSQKDIIVIHLNADLSLIRTKIFPAAGNQYGIDLIETTEGFIVLATTDVKREPATEVTGNAAGKKDILLLRLNKQLDILAEIPAVGFIGNDEGVAVKPGMNGGYIIVGTTDRSDRPSSEQAGTNIMIVRLNSDGFTVEPKIIGGVKNETASDFEVLNDGYMIAGTIGTGIADQQGYLWKMTADLDAEPEYQHILDIEPSNTIKTPYTIKAMCRYKSNSFLLAGQFGTGLSARMLIFSIDASGTPVENRKKITGGTGIQSANDVVSDRADNIIVSGSNSYENNSMICFLKFRF